MLLWATPVMAWEFTPGHPCRLTHQTEDVRLELTYDPTRPLYTITLTQDVAWPRDSPFSMAFHGRAGRVISTDQHQLSADGRALAVTDRGFGNVLDGLQFNDRATATLGARSIDIPLQGAADPVARFRRCAPAAGA